MRNRVEGLIDAGRVFCVDTAGEIDVAVRSNALRCPSRRSTELARRI